MAAFDGFQNGGSSSDRQHLSRRALVLHSLTWSPPGTRHLAADCSAVDHRSLLSIRHGADSGRRFRSSIGFEYRSAGDHPGSSNNRSGVHRASSSIGFGYRPAGDHRFSTGIEYRTVAHRRSSSGIGYRTGGDQRSSSGIKYWTTGIGHRRIGVVRSSSNIGHTSEEDRFWSPQHELRPCLKHISRDSNPRNKDYHLGKLRSLGFIILFVVFQISGQPSEAHVSIPSIPGSGSTESRDFCMHESFNASCRQGSVVLMLVAVYGRMRIGRCISGDFNIGCSKDVIAYFDSQCSARQSCDVSVRNLVDIHPCQRDFTSYLEASYRCITVAGVGLPVCPKTGKLLITGPSGHLSNVLGPYRTPVGTEECPWSVLVQPGQQIHLRIVILHSLTGSPSKADDNFVCSAAFYIREQFDSSAKKFGVCAGKSRERHLYTSAGNEVTVYVSRSDSASKETQSDKHGYPRFVISYEAIGCPELRVPENAWMKKVAGNVMIRCNDTMETWYFTCQKNQWIGDWGNCTHIVEVLKNEDVKEDVFSTQGIMVAVMIGVLLGIFIGMMLLFIVLCSRRRSRRQKLTNRSAVLGYNPSRSKDYKDALANFRRGSSRSRDGERYPALLNSNDHSASCAGDKQEKIYEFAGTEALCCGYPIAITTEYSIAAAAAAAAAAADKTPCSGQDRRDVVSSSVRPVDEMLTYARLPGRQPCPLCIRRKCQCVTRCVPASIVKNTSAEEIKSESDDLADPYGLSKREMNVKAVDQDAPQLLQQQQQQQQQPPNYHPRQPQSIDEIAQSSIRAVI